MICPECGSDSISLIACWLRAPFFTIRCPRCRCVCKLVKRGIGKISSYLLGGVVGALLALGITRTYWNATLFFSAVVVTVILDMYTDRRTILLMKADRRIEEGVP